MERKTYQINGVEPIESILAKCQDAVNNRDYPNPDYQNKKLHEITRESCSLPAKFLRYMGVK